MKILLIDNHDSFSAILHHYLWELTGMRPLFYRNDELTREELQRLEFDAAVLSPGPGHPENARDFGIGRNLLELYPQLPILGICLGHQGLAHFAGGKIIPLPNAKHGRPSSIRHDGKNLFQSLPQNFQAIRYHSLIVDSKSLPRNIEVTAWSQEDGQVMGLQFTDRPWFGVQFHPESIGTEQGKVLLQNFLERAKSKIGKSEIEKPGNRFSDTPFIPPSFASREIESHFKELAWKDPEAIFENHFKDAAASFWLDGSHSNPNAGWSTTVMGRAESLFEFNEGLEEFKTWCDELDLSASKKVPWSGYCGGPVGYFSYELNHQTWMLPEGYLVFDIKAKKVFAAWEKNVAPQWLLEIIEAWNDPEDIPASSSKDVLPPFLEWNPLLSRGEYMDRVRDLQRSIAKGDTYEACLTHAFSVESSADPLPVFRHLRARNPSPYAAYLAFPNLHVLSASPELFLELSSEGILRSRPIKGTRPRSADPEEDAAQREELSGNAKDKAENLMIVDLTRHDFSRVCELGSVRVTSLMEVETHPAVFQLVSEVRGKLESQRNPLEAFQACFPGGSMTGAPKERTMELLSMLEKEPRGIFSGALGYFTYGGAFNLSMVIRTLETDGNHWRIGCGGAVLADSDPEAEWNEATVKARSVIDAVGE